ncbi:MAG: phosphoribosyltransferase [Candidatus Baltobacteraceae bacterium]
MSLFFDRADAGRRLAASLVEYASQRDPFVLALPRGGVPVGYEVARALNAPLDVYVVRKLGVPGHEELAMGAVAADGSYVVDESTIDAAGITYEAFAATLTRELAELKRREIAYRGDRPEPNLAGKTAILVDDGLATGASMYSAIAALRQRRPAEIAVAVPVAPADTCVALQRIADRVFCPNQPAYFGAVGLYYQNFAQVDDEEVRRLLARAEAERKRWKVA